MRTEQHEAIGPHLYCDACGGIFPVEHETPDLKDVRLLAAADENLLAVWHITQLRSIPLYRENSPDSCADAGRADVRTFAEFMQLSGKSVLDIGSGAFARPGYVPNDVGDYVGIDPIRPESRPAFPVCSALAECLPFRDGQFDAVILATSLDHVLDMERTFEEIRRVLARNGSCYFWGTFGFKPAPQDPSIGRVEPLRLTTNVAIEHAEAVREYLEQRDSLRTRLDDIELRTDEFAQLLYDRFHFRHLDRGMVCAAAAKTGFGPGNEIVLAKTDVDEVLCLELVKDPQQAAVGRVFSILDERERTTANVATELRESMRAERVHAASTAEELRSLRGELATLREVMRKTEAERTTLQNKVTNLTTQTYQLSMQVASMRRNVFRRIGGAIVQVKNRLYEKLLTPRKTVHLFGLAVRGVFFGKRRKPAKERGKKVLMLTVSQIDIDSRINKVAATMADRGYEIEIICHQSGAYDRNVIEETVRPGVKYLRVKPDPAWTGKRYGLLHQESFRVAGLQREFDYVHVHDLTALYVGWSLSRTRGVPLIYDAHEIWTDNVFYTGSEWAPLKGLPLFLIRRFEGFLVKYCDVFLTVSPSIVEEFTRRYKLREPPVMLANFPDAALADRVTEETESVRDLCGLTDEHFVTLYIGGVNPLRNIETVIRAHQHLPDEFVFAIRGPGIQIYRDEYEELAKLCGVSGRIFYLDPVERDDIIAGTKGADCGIVMLKNLCPNFYWFYPNKFFEYMLAELPVAVSNFPDVTAHIEREKCGVVFDPESPESIAESLRRLASDPTEAKAMGQRGLAGIRERYNWDEATQGLMREYERLGSE